MSRPNRGDINHCICHVFQRGNNREFLFNDDDCKSMMIHQFDEFRKKYDYDLLGFVIMNNHYHIIIKLNNDMLDDIMFSINNIYAKYINKYLSRTGHVFESRYSNKIVDNDSYLLWLLRYIHRNPLRAQIVDRIEHYCWSSHNFYMKANNAFINTNFILSHISERKAQSISLYKIYVIKGKR